MINLDSDKLVRLPSLPTVAIEVLRALSNPDVAAFELVNLVSADPALSGKILQVANSARFGNTRPVGDVHRASMLLGKRVICSLSLGFSLADASMAKGPHAALFKAFWLRSFTRALAARTLAERYGGTPPDEAFTLGLVAQVGQLILLKHASEPYALCIAEAARLGRTLESIEAQLLGVTSAEQTLRMLSEWNLPVLFLDAVREQDSPPPDAPGLVVPTLASYLRVAAALANFIDGSAHGLHLVQLYETLSRFSATADDDAEWLLVRVTKLLRQNASLFNVDLSQVGTPTDLLSAATEQLAGLAISGLDPSETRPIPEELLEENGELRQRLVELTRESTVDPLTAVFNRRYFHRRLKDQVNRARDNRTHVGLLMVDIDHFKRINDSYGHAVGDRVLQLVADRVEQSMRGGDLVARYGGEEFVVLLEAQSLDGLRIAAERLRQAVSKVAVPMDDRWLSVTVSIGGCLGTPTRDDLEFETRLIGEADRCLYEAKAAGRNRCVSAGLPLQSATTPIVSRTPASLIASESST